jgi:hypothetical protein
MKKVLSLLFCSTILFTCSFGLSGCIFNRENPYPYQGEYKELYTTAIYSIPDAEGYMNHGEGAFNSDIYIWEKDDYGRTLFAYCEDFSNQIFGLVISQTYDEKNVYFERIERIYKEFAINNPNATYEDFVNHLSKTISKGGPE